MLAAFGAMDTPHIQHNTRPTVCGTVNISCGPCAPCAIAIPTKSLGKFLLILLSTTLKKPKSIPQTLRKSVQAPSGNVSSKIFADQVPNLSFSTFKDRQREKREGKKSFSPITPKARTSFEVPHTG
jgi:hypothetical protein